MLSNRAHHRRDEPFSQRQLEVATGILTSGACQTRAKSEERMVRQPTRLHREQPQRVGEPTGSLPQGRRDMVDDVHASRRDGDIGGLCSHYLHECADQTRLRVRGMCCACVCVCVIDL